MSGWAMPRCGNNRQSLDRKQKARDDARYRRKQAGLARDRQKSDLSGIKHKS